MLVWIDRLSVLLGRIATLAYFATGLMLGYDVAMLYLFVAPTIWSEELSRLCLVWGTWLAAAVLLHRSHHIRITILTERLPAGVRHVQETLVFLLVAAFAAAVVWY
ncbi:TRAP transporter small permease subunit [Breoghania sp.]|uniref:TRAP transporter small permease n=1 Tax=Breoghania sp. TaxID=2065378 RepID=UPI0026097CAA|nr:TRAP transporter small permease subunit [Breoghania sp.]MDJ0930179.1 TRAP transporter small permease subunit [Breoghania sp.]